MFESQWKPRPRIVPGRTTFAIERSDGSIVVMHPSCARDPYFYEGYNDAKDGLDYDWFLLGGTSVEAEEYRAGYLQACAEIAHAGEGLGR